MSKEQEVSINYYWAIEQGVSDSFNRSKAQIFNLMEAVITDQKQCNAVKGLIKGFMNHDYGVCKESMRSTAILAGYIDKEDTIFPQSIEPLEN